MTDQNKIIELRRSLDYRTPTRMLNRWWFTTGNIFRYPPSHRTLRGFWLVTGYDKIEDRNILQLCNSEGETIKFRDGGRVTWWKSSSPPPEYSYLWRNMNEGQHPAVDRYNAKCREIYSLFTDEMAEEQEEQARIKAELYSKWVETLSDFERKVLYFDWSFEYSDQHYPGKHTERQSIFNQIESMPYKDAINLWYTVGPHRHSENKNSNIYGRPDFSKCLDIEYPSEYILHQSTSDGYTFTHYPSEDTLEYSRSAGTNRLLPGEWDSLRKAWFAKYNRETPVYYKGLAESIASF